MKTIGRRRFLEASAGGIVGFVLGVVSAQLLTYVAEFPVYFSWKAFVIGLVLSWAVGVGFGLHPARQAANSGPAGTSQVKAVRVSIDIKPTSS